jgi:uncharacterized protein involved in response to NO
MQFDTPVHTTSSEKKSHQEPFSRVAPLLSAALLLGTGGGIILATILTLTEALHVPLGPWWEALVQAHGHLQLYGWAGLFVLGVAMHFFPRLRGAPLAIPKLVPWLLGALVTGLLFRAFSQPLFVVTGSVLWSILLIVSGILECLALIGAVYLLVMTARQAPPLRTRPALRGVLPFIMGAFVVLGITSCVNVVSVVLAGATGGLVPPISDNLNVTLGLVGFLVPLALAMSAQSLPMYAGLEAFPRPFLWPLAGIYWLGVLFTVIGIIGGAQSGTWAGAVEGLGMALLGAVLLLFIGIFLRMMRTRGQLPQRVTRLAPSVEAATQAYQRRIRAERNTYGPFVALVASAYLWAFLGGALLSVDGLALLFGTGPIFAIDAVRHSLTVGFITLLICGIAPRMLPGFSGGAIASPGLVSATLWLGNIAALLRVGSLLLTPVLIAPSIAGFSLYDMLFGLSGPIGLTLALCLIINLWPAIWSSRRGGL